MRAKKTEFIGTVLAPALALREHMVNIPVQDPIYIGPLSNPFKGFFCALSALSININEWVLIILVRFDGGFGPLQNPKHGLKNPLRPLQNPEPPNRPIHSTKPTLQ